MVDLILAVRLLRPGIFAMMISFRRDYKTPAAYAGTLIAPKGVIWTDAVIARDEHAMAN
jgi:hypothetical protein